MATSRRMLQQVVTAGEQKTSWPEVVGMGQFLATAKILGDRPDVHLVTHFVGETVPPGYDGKRVRIFVNKDVTWTVAQTPYVG